jgi:hypothetical protein
LYILIGQDENSLLLGSGFPAIGCEGSSSYQVPPPQRGDSGFRLEVDSSFYESVSSRSSIAFLDRAYKYYRSVLLKHFPVHGYCVAITGKTPNGTVVWRHDHDGANEDRTKNCQQGICGVPYSEFFLQPRQFMQLEEQIWTVAWAKTSNDLTKMIITRICTGTLAKFSNTTQQATALHCEKAGTADVAKISSLVFRDEDFYGHYESCSGPIG